MNNRIRNYLNKLEGQLINGNWKSIEFSKDWWMSFALEAGVYIIKDEGEICYVGESINIGKRMEDLLDTRSHILRQKIGNERFFGKSGFEKGTSNKNFPLKFEEELNRLFEDNFEVSAIIVKIGRKELAEKLVEKYKPIYNKRENIKLEQSQKAYSILEIRKSHGNAYRPWSKEEEIKLINLSNEGKTRKEVGSILGRKQGAISSRLKKIKERKTQ